MSLNLTSFKKVQLAALLAVSMLVLSSQTAFAQDEGDDKFSMSVSLNSDLFFGFYPFAAASYSVSDAIDLTSYSILWSGGTGIEWGNWTEFGFGVGIPVGDALYINPQLGLLNGNLLSSGAGGNAATIEGIVPSLTVLLGTDALEGELYAGYYTGFELDNPVDLPTNNYLHWWASVGYQVAEFLYVGGHFEHLQFAGGTPVDGGADLENFDIYMNVGPYVKLADPDGGAFIKFIAGTDIRSPEEGSAEDNGIESFFKASIGYGF